MKYSYIIEDCEHEPTIFDTQAAAAHAMKEHMSDIMEDEGDTLTGYVVQAIEQHEAELVRKAETKVTILKD